MNIKVVGVDEIRLPIACFVGKLGAPLTVSDINSKISRNINSGSGVCTYEELGLSEFIADFQKRGRLNASIALSKTTALLKDYPGSATKQGESPWRARVIRL